MGVKSLKPVSPPPLPVHPALPGPEQRRAAARRQLIRAAEDESQRTAGVDREALHAELLERLEHRPPALGP